MQLTSLKHGGIELKISDKIKVPKAWGYCMKKIGQKKAPPYFLHVRKWGGGFVNISVNQIGHFEK
jgi:hypothetical protein